MLDKDKHKEGKNKRRQKKHEERRLLNMPRNRAVWVGGTNKVDLAKNCFCQKLQTLLMFWRGEKGHFREHDLFRQNLGSSNFPIIIRNKNTIKRGSSADRGLNQKFLVLQKHPSLKGCLLSVIHKSCVLLKAQFYSKHGNCKKMVYVAKQQMYTKKSGLCFTMQ